MKLTIQIKLLPTPEQSTALSETLVLANSAADRLSQLCWETKEFRRFPLHKLFYYQMREEFPTLSSQVICLLNAKVVDAYKLDKDTQRHFRPKGSIAYDSAVLKIKVPSSTVSIWAVGGRLKMPFVCGDRQRKLLALPHGQADLFTRNDKWFLNVTVEVPEDKEIEAIDVIGVDMGVVNIAFDSDGNSYSGSQLNKVRNRNRRLRRKLQRKGTKSAKRLLRKRSKKEANFARNANHIISKRIVQNAKRTNRAIAIEDLTGIRARIRARKRERTKLHGWAFAQLGSFIAYKSQLAGVPMVCIDPANTSQRCSECGHTEKANRKSQAQFICKVCGHTENADGNGAKNIRLKGLEFLRTGALNRPHAETITYG